jgi:Fibronectin type III domain
MRKFGIPSAALIVTALWLAAPVSAAPPLADTPVVNTTHPGRFVVLLVAFIAVLWFGIVLYDRVSANRRHRDLMKFANKLVNDAHEKSGRGLSSREAGLLLKKVAQPPGSAPGLTRTLLALGLLMLIGIALVALLVSSSTAAADLLKTLVVALTAALTTILGFYFGAKTVSDAAPPAPPAAQPAGGVPGAPTGVSAVGGDQSAIVSFTPPSDTGGSAITGYTVKAYAADTLALTTQSTTADPVTVAGLTNGADYTFTVLATNASGDGPESAPSATVTPGA